MVRETVVATVVFLSVTASFPLYLKGAWIIIDAETVTWGVLTHHLRYIAAGLTLNTVPVAFWMLPRLVEQIGRGVTALHAVLGLQAYAMLAFALTGIVRIFQAKHAAHLYHDPDPDVDISALHENMDAWRKRLRIGVVGYVFFWLLAWTLGVYQYVVKYVLV